jgi:hypothetical protein
VACACVELFPGEGFACVHVGGHCAEIEIVGGVTRRGFDCAIAIKGFQRVDFAEVGFDEVKITSDVVMSCSGMLVRN